MSTLHTYVLTITSPSIISSPVTREIASKFVQAWIEIKHNEIEWDIIIAASGKSVVV